MPKLKERKPLPDVHEFSENIEGTHVGPSGGGSSKEVQLDLFTNLIAINKLVFCAVCFDDFKPADMGNDSRYCKQCEENLKIEWQVMVARGVKIKPGWVPRRNGETPHPTRRRKYQNNGHVTPIGELPIRKIKTMAAKGMKSNRIAAELIKQGYTVNYRAIAKLISNGGGSNGNKTKSRAKPERLSTIGTKKPRGVSARS